MLPGMPASRLARGYDPRLPGAVMFYALGVLLLLVTFPTRLDLVAIGWGILAGGDGAATFAGRAWGGPRWAWNATRPSPAPPRSSSRARRWGFCWRGGCASVLAP